MPAKTRYSVVLVVLVAFACSVPAYGQRGRQSAPSQVPRFTPSTPTVSPYLNLLNRNGGSAAQNYFGLVRPLQRQQGVNEKQSSLSAYNQREIQGIRDQGDAFSQPDVKPTGTAGWFNTLATDPHHQVGSHFFGQWNTGGGRGRGSQRR